MSQDDIGIPPEVCAYNRSVATNFLYILPQIICSISGIASVAVLTYSFFLYGFRLLFHENAKVRLNLKLLNYTKFLNFQALMILLTIFCLIFSIDVTFVCTRQIFKALTYKNDCDLLFTTATCSIYRRAAL